MFFFEAVFDQKYILNSNTEVILQFKITILNFNIF